MANIIMVKKLVDGILGLIRMEIMNRCKKIFINNYLLLVVVENMIKKGKN